MDESHELCSCCSEILLGIVERLGAKCDVETITFRRHADSYLVDERWQGERSSMHICCIVTRVQLFDDLLVDRFLERIILENFSV